MAKYILTDEDGYVKIFKNKDELIDYLMMSQFMDCQLEVVK